MPAPAHSSFAQPSNFTSPPSQPHFDVRPASALFGTLSAARGLAQHLASKDDFSLKHAATTPPFKRLPAVNMLPAKPLPTGPASWRREQARAHMPNKPLDLPHSLPSTPLNLIKQEITKCAEAATGLSIQLEHAPGCQLSGNSSLLEGSATTISPRLTDPRGAQDVILTPASPVRTDKAQTMIAHRIQWYFPQRLSGLSLPGPTQPSITSNIALEDVSPRTRSPPPPPPPMSPPPPIPAVSPTTVPILPSHSAAHSSSTIRLPATPSRGPLSPPLPFIGTSMPADRVVWADPLFESPAPKSSRPLSPTLPMYIHSRQSCAPPLPLSMPRSAPSITGEERMGPWCYKTDGEPSTHKD